MHHRLADKTEQHEAVQEKLHHKEELLSEVQGERNKTNREGSSRVANLNQALMKVGMETTSLSLLVLYVMYLPPLSLLLS